MLSERLSETRLYKDDKPGGMETSKLEDKSRCVSEERCGRDSAGINVSALSANERCLRKAHLDGGNWGEAVDSVGEESVGGSSLVGVTDVSSTCSSTESGRRVLWNDDCRERLGGSTEGKACLRAESSFTAWINKSDMSSSPLRFTVRLHKLSESLSQPRSARGSMSLHSRHCRLRNESNGNAFSFGGSSAISTIFLGPGACSDSAGIFVKLLKIYFSSWSTLGSSGRVQRPTPSESRETADREERMEESEMESDESPL
jgi:hypothetical protein